MDKAAGVVPTGDDSRFLGLRIEGAPAGRQTRDTARRRRTRRESSRTMRLNSPAFPDRPARSRRRPGSVDAAVRRDRGLRELRLDDPAADRVAHELDAVAHAEVAPEARPGRLERLSW